MWYEYEFAKNRRTFGPMPKKQRIDTRRSRGDDWRPKSNGFQVENGLCVNFGTVNRIAEALGVEPIVALKSKKKADKNLIDYVMTVIVEFARRHDLTIREASNYIRRFKGIDFLTEFYDVEHTLSFNDCVDDLTIVCQNNGGTLR